MSKNLSNVVKRIFISSLSGISAANASENNTENNSSLDYQITHRIKKLTLANSTNKDLNKKLLLKLNNQGLLEFRSHRSHRSHSSHRSHYSSSGSSTTPRSSSNNSSNSGIQPVYNDPSPNVKLGSRVLRLGMSGYDVTELINILLKRKYLALENGNSFVSGEFTYDAVIEDAVRRFQINNNLEGTGVCDVKTVYLLKN